MLKSLVCIFCVLTMFFTSINVSAVSYDDDTITEYIKSTYSETDADAISLLEDDVVFMTTGNFFVKGEKLSYSDYGDDAYEADGKIMVDIEVLNYALSTGEAKNEKLNVGQTEIELVQKDGSYFADAALVARALSKYVYDTDKRGFVLISDEERNYSDSASSRENQETIDIIWRYMQFDRPTGDEIYDALISSNQNHPRLFIKKDEISSWKERVNDDSELNSKKTSLLRKCNSYLSSDLVAYKKVGIRLFGACYSVKERLINLCTAYLLTEDSAYAERAWLEMENALVTWEDWNLSTHFLDSGEIGPGIAFAYDVLYDYLTDEQKRLCREKIQEKYLDFCVAAYSRNTGYNVTNYRARTSNWGAVCGTSMFMVALTFMDEEAADSILTQKCKYIASNALQTLEHIVTAIGTEGSWHEGMGYYEYVLQHTAWSFEVMSNALGTDYNFLSSQGLSILPDYIVYNQTQNGTFNKSSTNGTPKLFAPETMLYASLYSDPDRMKIYNEFYQKLNLNTFQGQYLLFYDSDLSKKADKLTLPVDKYYESIGTGIIRESWTNDDGLYTAVSGGVSGHYDKGSFIFESLGERWSIDLGRNGSSTMPFVNRTDVHSALVINPSADHKGQKNDVFAKAVKFENKPAGGQIVYDLGDVYGEWVSEYYRGFLVSDNRNTLTVRDELTLTEESELQWQLITRADIEISSDGKSATLTQNGKKLDITAYCSEEDWHFEATSDAAPTGGWIDGDVSTTVGNEEFSTEQQIEFANGAKKLLLKATGSGDVAISVKLAPQIYGESFEAAKNTSMSMWTIPDGEKYEIIRLLDITDGTVVNSGNDVLFNVVADGAIKSIKVYADENLADTVTTQSADAVYMLTIPKNLMTLAGDMKIDIYAEYESYTAHKSFSLNVIKEYEILSKKLVDFSKYPDDPSATTYEVRTALGLHDIVLKDGYGAISKSTWLFGECLKFSLYKSKETSSGAPYIQLQKLIGEDNIIHLSFDVLTNERDNGIVVSFGAVENIFNTGGTFLDGSVSYSANTVYHIDIVVDTVNGVYRIVIVDENGNAVAEKRASFAEDNTYNDKFRITFKTYSGDDGYFLIDNYSISTYKYLQFKTEKLEMNEEKFIAKHSLASNEFDVTSLKYILAFYDDENTLCIADIKKADSIINFEYNVPQNAQSSKIMLWTQELVPLTKSINVVQ